ncbi:MAG: MarR family winged helix-turn-helix transcriptional regulator [Zhenhengia sp.]|uniref:MarR family winged helix-turn-helix transcriptional regulator n=1 Tax=Zhenhengia sp. TaxID=2944208 RepID=UPI0039947ECE
MYNFETMDKRLIIFGNLFLVANRLQTVMDSQMEGLTAKQWLVLTMLGMFDEPPTLKQLAKMCNTSHQNTKQLVLKLESKGFLEVTKDPKDARAMRICATAKCTEWELANQENNAKFVNQMFFTLTQKEILVTMTSLLKIYDALEDMANEQK